MEFSIMSLCAAVSVGISAACLLLLAFNMIGKIEVDTAAQQQGEEVKRIPILFRFFMPFVPNVARIIRSDNMSGHIKRAQDRIATAGYDLALTGEQFISIRILMGATGTVAGLGLMLGGTAMMHKMLGFLIIFLGLSYPTVWLNGIIRRRHLQILKSLPNVLDLLTLSVEAGKDFLTALRDIMSRRKPDALGEELGRALHEIQLGKKRQLALREMAMRVQQPDLISVVNAIVQADELGVSIGHLLRIQGDQLRNKRFARAEKLANEAPVKILFPVVVFIFPSVIIILVAPILMQAARTLMR